jgi:hypothetical protein
MISWAGVARVDLRTVGDQIPAGVRDGLEVSVDRDLYDMKVAISFRKAGHTTVVTHKIDAAEWPAEFILPDEVIAKICAVL